MLCLLHFCGQRRAMVVDFSAEYVVVDVMLAGTRFKDTVKLCRKRECRGEFCGKNTAKTS